MISSKLSPALRSISFRRGWILGILIILPLLLAGCFGNGESNGVADPTPKGVSGSLTIAGSTSVQPIAEMLAQAFEEHYPNARINVQGGGSTAGIKAVSDGAADIGTSSRELAPEEKGLVETLIARDAIAVIVHPSNPVNGITIEQLRSVFSGKITDWSELGGNSGKIVLVNRESGSGTRGAFEEIVMGSEPIDSRAIVQGSTGAVRQAVSGDPNAIGYVSLASVNESVKVIDIEGVSPSEQTVLDGTYKIARPFLMLTKEEPSGLAAEFLEFALSEEGQELVSEEGLVSVTRQGGEK